MRKLSPLLALALALVAACEGPAGIAGPAGPKGSPGTHRTFTATVQADGVGFADLPPAAGTLDNPPVLTCYLGQTPTSSHFVVGFDLTGPTCGLGSTLSGLQAIIIDAPPGWSVKFAIVY